MLEITPTTRLVRHHCGSQWRWQAQNLIDHPHPGNRPLWQPCNPLMSSTETLVWLSRKSPNPETLDDFRRLAGIGEH